MPETAANPRFTDSRYHVKIRYNDNLTGTKSSLKMLHLILNYTRTLYVKRYIFVDFLV